MPRTDALHAMMNFIGAEEIDGEPDETTMVYVGHPHGRTIAISRSLQRSSPQARVTALAAAENRRESDIVRDAITSYLDARSA
ncbi:hypothetical protein C5B85_13410 [Pseudoclavibacter sp. AY1F1]|nr:hypothetical protein C5B85_13410 [Pseudoclavibacter sp. AY1F1]